MKYYLISQRYLIFRGVTFYSGGSWDVFFGAVNTIEEAQKEIKTNSASWDWWEVVDSETGDQVMFNG